MTISELKYQSKISRVAILQMLAKAGGGHIAPAFSCIDIMTSLFFHCMKVDPHNPKWEERDRFLLSKGHGCAALYVTLAEKGFFPKSRLELFCQPDGILGGHPDRSVPGIEISSGSLGHGLSLGVGMALAARLDKKDWRTYVLMSDGECHEGSVWEAAQAAGHFGLTNLTLIIDYNKLISLGPINDIIRIEPLADRWRSFGWGVREIDGHDMDQIVATFSRLPVQADRPSVIIAHTVKGKGVSFMENQPIWHYRVPKPDELEQALKELS